jgi:glycosyltransferase involved in cell wall biosynthesis
MNKPFFTIGVMCYNEEGSIERVVNNIFEELGELVELQVLVVDDGSSDKSVEIVKKMQSQYDRLDLIAKSENIGIGGTLCSIYTQAMGDYVVAIPGDGQFDICELTPFLGFKKGEFVNLYRTENTTYGLFRNSLSLLNKMINKLLVGLDIKDVNWILVFRTEDLHEIFPIELKSNILTSEICAKLVYKGAKILEAESRYLPRTSGKSRGASLKIVWKAAMETARLIWVVRRYKWQNK